MMALQLSEDRISFTPRRNEIIEGLHSLPGLIKQVLDEDKALQELATGVLAQSRSLLLMGRGYQYAQHLSRVIKCINTHMGYSDMLPASRVLSRSRKSATCIPKVSSRVN